MKEEEWPETLDEAIDFTLDKLSDSERARITDMLSTDLIDLHFGLGMWIRHNCGLWRGNHALKQAIGKTSYSVNPDAASGIILRGVWKRLHPGEEIAEDSIRYTDGQSHPAYSHTCSSCVHYKGGLNCKAFPEGIPEEIYLLPYGHREPYPGDHGVLFEQRPKPDPIKEREEMMELFRCYPNGLGSS